MAPSRLTILLEGADHIKTLLLEEDVGMRRPLGVVMIRMIIATTARSEAPSIPLPQQAEDINIWESMIRNERVVPGMLLSFLVPRDAVIGRRGNIKNSLGNKLKRRNEGRKQNCAKMRKLSNVSMMTT
jgi:hypothetical protein